MIVGAERGCGVSTAQDADNLAASGVVALLQVGRGVAELDYFAHIEDGEAFHGAEDQIGSRAPTWNVAGVDDGINQATRPVQLPHNQAADSRIKTGIDSDLDAASTQEGEGFFSAGNRC